MQITVKDDFAAATRLDTMTPAETHLALAIGLFAEERLTLAEAARLAGLDRLTFQRHLASRQIPVHYGEEELAADLETLKWLIADEAQER